MAMPHSEPETAGDLTQSPVALWPGPSDAVEAGAAVEVEAAIYQDLTAFTVAPDFRGRSGMVVLLWQIVQATLFGLSPQPFNAWRRAVLRLFGAEVGAGVVIRPTARVTYPWKVRLRDHCWIGDRAELYSLGRIDIGRCAVVSQRSYLCAGSHDLGDVRFPLVAKPIVVEPEAWIATDCFLAPGVTIGRGAVVAARSTVLSDIPPGMIAAGAPATVRKPRPVPPARPCAPPPARKTVVAIGQFPPPINGFSAITARVVERLGAGHDVTSFDIAARAGAGVRKHLSRLLATLRACRGLVAAPRRGGTVCYIACEGGAGLLYTLLLVATARLRRLPVLLHHHSFNYIDQPNRLMRLLLAVGPEIRHVFLCATMRDAFERRYARILGTSIVLSNAAFVPPQPAEAAPMAGDRIVLGHLSNLTREKGLYLFLDLMRAARAAGLPVRGRLAGPVALEEDRAAIAAAVADLDGELTFDGPLYGAAKDAFYAGIDVFVFPTHYANEAQPTVLFEAQAACNLIVAYDRGCIAAQVAGDGLVVGRQDDFVAAGLDWLRQRVADGDLTERRAAVRRTYAARWAEAQTTIDDLVTDDADHGRSMDAARRQGSTGP